MSIENDMARHGMISISGNPWVRVKVRKAYWCQRCGDRHEKGTMAYRPLMERAATVRWARFCVPCGELIAEKGVAS